MYITAFHNESFDNVAVLNKISKGFALSEDRSVATIAAAIPRSAIPYLPPLTKGLRTGADLSCNIKGFQKGWWVNYNLDASRVTWDEPSEADLYPASWGNLTLA